MPLTIGETFAGYLILRLLGSGGMGEVYLAQHPRLPRQDALKVLRADISSDLTFRERFIREADLAAALWHPHIVGVHDRGECEGQLWIAMDYVDGVDAAQLMQRRYPAGMPVEEVADIVTAVASALDYAHKRGLLHRDVKPANIMLSGVDDDERRILLTDFGIARPVDEVSGLTTTNMAIGTVAYSAPEQLLGEDIDGRADQYALAATAHHLLTGSQLFPHSSPAVVIGRHLNAAPPPISTRRAELADLNTTFMRALSKNPADRYTRCGEFAAALAKSSVRPVAGAAPSVAKGSVFQAPLPADATMPAAMAVESTYAAPARRVAPAVSSPSEEPVTAMAGRRRSLRRGIVVPAVLASILIIAGVTVAGIYLSRRGSPPSTVPGAAVTTTAKRLDTTAVPAPAPTTTPAPAPRPAFAKYPVRLQFDVLRSPKSIAVDASGDLYIGDWDVGGGRLFKLPAGATSPTLLPINGLSGPCAIAVNKRGDLYILDGCSNAGSTLLKIPASSSTPVELTPNLPSGAWDIAVDSQDNLYLACSNRFGSQLVKVAPGTTEPTVVPHPGLESVAVVAIDSADNLYVGGSQGAVIKIDPTSPEASMPLPFPTPSGSTYLAGITVDAAGTVYATTTNYGGDPVAAPSAVAALPAGASAPITLNFADMVYHSDGIAVDDSGVYVISGGSSIDQNGYVVLLRRSG